jgi:uncharacterized membrane protein YfcA
LSVLIGLSPGLLGSGGSIITLPVLVYVARVPAQQAVGMSLVIVGGTSALGTLLNLRQGAFDFRAATFFVLSGMVGAFIGAKFTHLVSAPVLLLLFGALLLAYGIGHCAVIVVARTSTELVQRFLNWNEQSKGVAVVKNICGLLVILGGVWLIYTAP